VTLWTSDQQPSAQNQD